MLRLEYKIKNSMSDGTFEANIGRIHIEPNFSLYKLQMYRLLISRAYFGPVLDAPWVDLAEKQQHL